MKVEICEHCGKPGDYPRCDAPHKPRKPRKPRKQAPCASCEALQSRVAELESALRILAGQVMQGLEANGSLEQLNNSPSLKLTITEAQKLLEPK